MKSNPVCKLIFTIFVSGLIVTGCGSSTGTRYVNGKDKKSEKEKTKKELNEDFDITPYRTKITIKDVSKDYKPVSVESINAWYDYKQQNDSTVQNKVVVNTVNGYRVQVLATDDLHRADSLRTELNRKLDQKQVYIIFDPPFYRVEVGDFVEVSTARDLKFKLNQLGYTESRVVNEKVNIYQ